MTSRILLVDDDPNVLSGYRRQLRRQFEMETAESGPAGLQVLLDQGPFAVVVSDMRMPGMDGIAFLGEVRTHAPETIRMMLTGNADLQTCIDAVNEGNIFRFLTKPCAPEDMARALTAGVEQYRLVKAEQELLHGTLRGCLRTLSDILGVMSPAAFSRGARIRRYVRHIAAELNSPYFWECETAATLSQIGCVALPPEILERLNENRVLSDAQRAIMRRHPAMGCQLLAEIPRLELVARMIERQSTVPRSPLSPRDLSDDEKVVEFGAQMLRVALDLDYLLEERLPFIGALNELHKMYGADHPMVEALMSFEKDSQDRVVMEIRAAQLSSGMAAVEDIVSKTGHILVRKGQSITEPLRLRLLNCAQADGLHEPFKVEVISGGS